MHLNPLDFTLREATLDSSLHETICYSEGNKWSWCVYQFMTLTPSDAVLYWQLYFFPLFSSYKKCLWLLTCRKFVDHLHVHHRSTVILYFSWTCKSLQQELHCATSKCMWLYSCLCVSCRIIQYQFKDENTW